MKKNVTVVIFGAIYMIITQFLGTTSAVITFYNEGDKTW